MNMFCYQCEQTAKGTGCTASRRLRQGPGDGHSAGPAGPRDQGHLRMYAHRAARAGRAGRGGRRFVVEALFTTRDQRQLRPRAAAQLHPRAAGELRDQAKTLYEDACAEGRASTPETLDGPAAWQPAADIDGLIAPGRGGRHPGAASTTLGEDVAGLQELIIYGLKGTAAYADHAAVLGQEDDEVYAFFHEALDFLADATPTVDELLAHGAEGRRAEPEGHGPAGRGQHRRLRPSRADRRCASRRSRARPSSSPATT